MSFALFPFFLLSLLYWVSGANFMTRYHHLNHHAIFGGGYRSGAVSIMEKLIRKYGNGR